MFGYNNTSKKIVISITLFALIIILIGAPNASWFFYESDELDTLYRAFKTQSLRDWLHCFIQGDVRGMLPDRPGFINGDFFDTFYRPLVLILESIRYHLFGLSAHAYHLSNVFVHGINTVIIFWVTCTYTSRRRATLAALFFGFHPQIAYNFGRIDCLQYGLNTILIMAIILLFKHYLDTNNIIWCIPTGILFMISFFLRETIVALPLIITVGAYLYTQSLKTTLRSTSFLWAINVILIGIRLWLHPLALNKSPLPWLARESTLIKKIYFLATTSWAIISDMLSLSWFTPTNQLFKLGLVVIVISFLTYLFIRTNHKKYALFALGSSFIMLWPAYLTGGYHPRYLYEAMPFVIMFFVALSIGYHNKFVTMITTITLGFYIFLSIECFAIKRTNLGGIEKVFYEIEQQLKTNRPIWFIGTPSKPFGDGLPNLVRVACKEKQPIIYFDGMLPAPQAPTKSHHSYQTITPLTPSSAYSIDLDRQLHIHITAEKPLPTINIRYGSIQTIAPNHIIIIPSPEIFEQKTIIITWDYTSNTFKVLFE